VRNLVSLFHLVSLFIVSQIWFHKFIEIIEIIEIIEFIEFIEFIVRNLVSLFI
jgi:hypothetical protein